MKGNKGSEARKRSVIASPIAGGKELYFGSISAACGDGFQSGNIIRAIKGHRQQHKGYAWRYAEPGEVAGVCTPIKLVKKKVAYKQSLKVIGSPVDGGDEVEYSSIADCAAAIGVRSKLLERHLRDKGISINGGYVWRYAKPGERPGRCEPLPHSVISHHQGMIASPVAGGTEFYFESTRQAADHFSIKWRRVLHRHCRNISVFRGYRWRYVERGEVAQHAQPWTPPKKPKVISKRRKPVLAISVDGETTRWFESLNFADQMGFNRGKIRQCANGKLPYYRGYRWEWASKLDVQELKAPPLNSQLTHEEFAYAESQLQWIRQDGFEVLEDMDERGRVKVECYSGHRICINLLTVPDDYECPRCQRPNLDDSEFAKIERVHYRNQVMKTLR